MKVVITGFGTISSAGCGEARLAAALARGTPHWSHATPHPLLPTSRPSAVALADESELGNWVEARIARRMSRPSKLILAAARMAAAEAALGPETLAADPTATVIATAFGTASFAEELVKAIAVDPQGASPFHFSESVANAPAAQVAIQLGARGTNVAITQREAGPWLALGAGAREIALGRARYALVGGVDEVNPLVSAALQRFSAVASVASNGDLRNRPFDPASDGFLPAEGAVCFVLESEESARARGVTARAQVLGSGRAFDPSAPQWSWGRDARELAAAIVTSLDRLGLGPEQLAAWCANASGARRADSLEATVLDLLFPTSAPLLLTPKRVVGEYSGLALAAAFLHLGGEPGPAVDSWRSFEPQIARAVATHPEPSAPLLSLGLASGGAAAWTVLTRT